MAANWIEEEGEERAGSDAVQDRYVARRLAEHHAAIAEADRQHAEQQGAVGTPGETRFGSYVLLGIVVAALLLAFIAVVTRGLTP